MWLPLKLRWSLKVPWAGGSGPCTLAISKSSRTDSLHCSPGATTVRPVLPGPPALRASPGATLPGFLGPPPEGGCSGDPLPPQVPPPSAAWWYDPDSSSSRLSPCLASSIPAEGPFTGPRGTRCLKGITCLPHGLPLPDCGSRHPPQWPEPVTPGPEGLLFHQPMPGRGAHRAGMRLELALCFSQPWLPPSTVQHPLQKPEPLKGSSLQGRGVAVSQHPLEGWCASGAPQRGRCQGGIRRRREARGRHRGDEGARGAGAG